MKYLLQYEAHERTGNMFDLDGEWLSSRTRISMSWPRNWSKTAERNYNADPDLSVKDWFDDDANTEDVNSAVEDWFNDNNDYYDNDSAREFYNLTISCRDIEVTIDRDYFVELGDDTFLVHVDDTWDEMYRNEEAIQLAKSNYKLGQKYLEMYFSKNDSADTVPNISKWLMLV